MPKGAWKEYFVFSKGERRAVFILLGIIAAFIVLPYFFKPRFSSPTVDATVQKQLTALAAKTHNNIVTADSSFDDADSAKAPNTASSSKIKPTLFYFDPNTLDLEGWKRLGFREKTIENIQTYRRSNGNFKKPEDLYKVPRIRKKVVATLLPYIKFGASANQAYPQNNPLPQKTAVAKDQQGKITSYKLININTATPEDFKVFPGITDAIAARIVKFRTKLNGFTTVDEVAKTYGLPDSTFKIMRPYLVLAPR